MSDLHQKLLAKKRTEAAHTPADPANTPDRKPDPDRFRPRVPGHPNLMANVPGEVRNPTGKNQYSAGQAYRDTLEKLWLEKALTKAEHVKPEDFSKVQCVLCGMLGVDLHLGFSIFTHSEECLAQLQGLKPIEVLAIQERAATLRSEGDARAHLRKTFNPASKQIELSTNPDKPFAVTTITRKIIKA